MKNLICFAFLFACFAFTTPPKKTLSRSEEQATIYIYRTGQFMGSTANWSMWVDEKKICKLSNNKFIKVTVDKGKHIVASKQGGVSIMKKEMEIEIDAEPGKSYYVSCNVKTSFTRARLEMLEVTQSTGKKQMEKLTLDNCQEE
ncbi:MAG: DUF2846 domain-containing protein [Flavisolibacter sp.]